MEQTPNKIYQSIRLPLDYNKNLLDLTKAEIQQYYKWFLNIKNSRLDVICDFLFSNPNNCISENNLNVIELFLQSSVNTFTKIGVRYESELKNIPAHLKSISKPKSYFFDEKTISICYDIGIFLGQLIIKLDDKITWRLEHDQAFDDYGQPVLHKKRIQLEINPFIVVKNMAAKIHEGRYTEGQLISAFNAWKKLFKVD